MPPPQSPEQQLFFPAEINIAIFQIAISIDVHSLAPLVYRVKDDSEIRSRLRDRQTTPLTLGAVCRSWRSLVWGVPSLWSTITINFPKEELGPQLEILDMWLTNSASCPLTIASFSLSRTPYGYYEWDGIPLSALEMIVDHSERWENIGLGAIGRECIPILEQIEGRIPMLRTLHFRLPNFGIRQFHIDMFDDAPLLRGASVSPYRSKAISLPLHQLTSYTGESSDVECICILTHCISLRECHFIGIYKHAYKLAENMDRISRPHLQTLCISDTSGTAIQSTFNGRIKFPELRELRLSISLGETASLLNLTVIIALAGCKSSLEILEVVNDVDIAKLTSSRHAHDSNDFSSHIHIHLMAALPRLKKLIIRHKQATGKVDYFLDKFIPKLDLSSSPVFLPQLTEFRYTALDSVHISAETHLVKILRQRSNPPTGVAKLQNVVIHATLECADSKENVAISTDLRELLNSGMRISVTGINM